MHILSLQKALDKLKERIKQKETLSTSVVIENLAENVIAISNVEKIEILDIDNIMYLEADGKYTIFHLANASSKMVSRNIVSYTDILPKINFLEYTINILSILAKQRVSIKLMGTIVYLKTPKLCR
nr:MULTISPECIES: hypothetical protein [unclassified Polaribacter]